MRIDVLASGSAGNATVVTHEGESILIDAGLSAERLLRRIRRNCLAGTAHRLGAILLTHEHIDHACSADALSTKLRIPVICTEGTAKAITWGKLSEVLVIPGDCIFRAGGFEAKAIPVSHDAAEPCGFVVRTHDGFQLSYFMDMGNFSEEAADVMRASSAIFLESNHDEAAVEASDADPFLKRRLLSDRGHLSNRAAACGLQRVTGYPFAPKRIIIGHLSHGHNRPELVRAEIAAAGITDAVSVIPNGSELTVSF